MIYGENDTIQESKKKMCTVTEPNLLDNGQILYQHDCSQQQRAAEQSYM